MLAFFPARSCHVQLQEEFGVFAPPVYHGNININLWCNWTIWAGPGKHIVIYITGFQINADCDENRDEIIFEGVSSTVENTVVYACWNKYTHVFATQAKAVHIVFLWRSFSRISSRKYFEGKYYIFNEPILGSSPHYCSPTSTETKIPESTELLNKTQNGIPRALSGFSYTPVLHEQSTVRSVSSIRREPISGASRQEHNPTSNVSSVPTSSPQKKYEISTQVTFESDLVANYVESTLPLSVDYSTANFLWEVPSGSGENSDLYELSEETVTSSSTQQEKTNSLWYWQKDYSHWGSRTLPSELYEDLTKTISTIQSSILYQLEDTVKNAFESDLIMQNTESISKPLSTDHSSPELQSTMMFNTYTTTELLWRNTESIYTPFLSSDHSSPELQSKTFYTHDAGLVSPVYNGPTEPLLSSRTNHEEPHSIFMWDWQTILPNLFSETPYLGASSILQPVTNKEFTKDATPLWVTDLSEHEILTLSPLSDTHPDIQLIASIEELSPSIAHVTNSAMIAKAKTILGDLQMTVNPTIPISETPKNVETRAMDTMSSEFHAYPSEAKTTNLWSPIPLETYPTKDFPTIPLNNLSFLKAYVTVSDPQLLLTKTHSKYTATFTGKNPLTTNLYDIKENLTVMPTENQSVYMASPYLTHRVTSNNSHLGGPILGMRQLEPWAITPSTEHMTPEHTTLSTPLLNLQLSQFVEIPRESSTFFIKHKSQTKESDDPSLHSASKPTTELHTAPNKAADGIVEELRSTYQSTSDIDDFHFEAGNPRGGFFDVDITEDTTGLMFPHAPGDFLFAINAEVTHDEILSGNLEKKLTESMYEMIDEKLLYFTNQSPSIWPIQSEKRTKVNPLMSTFWVHLKHGGSDVPKFLTSLLKTLTNRQLGMWNATITSISVEDVNECQVGIQQCHSQAHCVNDAGTYSCICMTGYEDRSHAAPGTVCVHSQSSDTRFFYDHFEILIGAIAVVIVVLLILIVTLCVVLQKRHGKGNFSLEESVRTNSEVTAKPSQSPETDSEPTQGRPTITMSPSCAATQHAGSGTSSKLELTKITVEHTAC
ncbi:uncharacterized protein O3C94_004650 [Discoglossus pictus]